MKNKLKVYQLNKDGSLKDVSDDFHTMEVLQEDLTEKFREGLIKVSVKEASSLINFSREELSKRYEEEFARVSVYKNKLTEFKSITITCTNSDGKFLIVLPNKYRPNYDIMTNTEHWLSNRYKRALEDIDIFKININENITNGNNDSRNPKLKYVFVKIGYEYGDNVSFPIPLKELDPSNPKSGEYIEKFSKVIEENIKNVANNMIETNDILNK